MSGSAGILPAYRVGQPPGNPPARCRRSQPGVSYCVPAINLRQTSFCALELLQCGNLRLQFPANPLELLVLLRLHLLQMFDGRLLVGR